jgi:hypothetical protein
MSPNSYLTRAEEEEFRKQLENERLARKSLQGKDVPQNYLHNQLNSNK